MPKPTVAQLAAALAANPTLLAAVQANPATLRLAATIATGMVAQRARAKVRTPACKQAYPGLRVCAKGCACAARAKLATPAVQVHPCTGAPVYPVYKG